MSREVVVPEPMPEDVPHFQSMEQAALPIVAWLEDNIGPVPVAGRWKYIEAAAHGVVVKAWLYESDTGGYVEWRVGFNDECGKVGYTRLSDPLRKVPAAVLVAAECVRMAKVHVEVF